MKNKLDVFYKEIEDANLYVDEIIIFKGDKLITSANWLPFKSGSIHRLYSATKTLTMLAVGILVTENKIKLTDYIYKYFPYEVDEELIKKMTIADLLKMQTTFMSTTYKRSEGSWLASFFKTKPEKAPGNLFAYDTSASYTLAALVELITEKPLLDFVKSYFPFSKESYMINSPENIASGGSGLMGTINDLILLGKIIKEDGIGYINKEYIKLAKTKHSDTSEVREGESFKYGYGYQLWINPSGGFIIYGMGGQLYYYDLDNDLTLVSLSNLMDNKLNTQKLINIFNNNINKFKEENNYHYLGYKFKVRNDKMTFFSETYYSGEDKIVLEINDDKSFLLINKDRINFSFNSYFEGEFLKTMEIYQAQATLENNNIVIKLFLVGQELGVLTIKITYSKEEIKLVAKGDSEDLLKKWNFIMKGKKN